MSINNLGLRTERGLCRSCPWAGSKCSAFGWGPWGREAGTSSPRLTRCLLASRPDCSGGIPANKCQFYEVWKEFYIYYVFQWRVWLKFLNWVDKFNLFLVFRRTENEGWTRIEIVAQKRGFLPEDVVSLIEEVVIPDKTLKNSLIRIVVQVEIISKVHHFWIFPQNLLVIDYLWWEFRVVFLWGNHQRAQVSAEACGSCLQMLCEQEQLPFFIFNKSDTVCY